MYDNDLIEHAKQDLPAIRENDDATENGSCGDRVAVRSLQPVDIAVDGCLVCRAATAKVTELCDQIDPAYLQEMDAEAFLEALGWELSPARKDCALTVLRALRQA